ncbi:hypothetical protein V6Z11_D12G169700 [Gossypium hirsutum]
MVEMAERRAKGLCYNCDEFYSMRHKCKRLFWIEVLDVEGEQNETRLLLNTNKKHPTFNTLKHISSPNQIKENQNL